MPRDAARELGVLARRVGRSPRGVGLPLDGAREGRRERAKSGGGRA